MTKLNSPLKQRTIDNMTFRNMPPNSEKVTSTPLATSAPSTTDHPTSLGSSTRCNLRAIAARLHKPAYLRWITLQISQ
jgi:hypothetical protein